MADCDLLHPVGCGANALGSAVGAAVNDQTTRSAKDLFDGANGMWTQFFTSWATDAPLPVIGGEAGAWMSFILSNLQVLLIALGLIVAGVVTMFQVNGEAAREGLRKYARAVMVQLLGTGLIVTGTKGANAFAGWVLTNANLKAAPEGLIGKLEQFGGNATLALIFGGITTILVMIQWCIVIFRSVALSTVTPYWPVAASLGMFKKFESSYDRVTSWVFAFMFYSPIAASLYGFALVLKSGTNGLQGVIYGIIILLIAIAAMPALMKLVAPMANAVGTASAAGVAWEGGKIVILAAAAAGAAIATGGAGAAPAAAGAAGTAGGSTAAAEGLAATEGIAAANSAAAATEGGAAATQGATAEATASTGSAGASGTTGAAGAASAGPEGAATTGAEGAPGPEGAPAAEGAPGADAAPVADAPPADPAPGAEDAGSRGDGFSVRDLAGFMGQMPSTSVSDAFIDEQYRDR